MSRSLKVNIVEVKDCPFPQIASYGPFSSPLNDKNYYKDLF